MNNKQKANYISLIVLLACLLVTVLIYEYSGRVIIAILFAPPIIHWILKRKYKNTD